MVLCLCPAKAAHNCCPIRSLLVGGPRNSILCPQQSRKMSMARSEKQQFMSAAIPIIVHGEVRRTAIYVHSNPEKCPWRGPKKSNLYKSRKIIHGVDPDDERSKRQIAMCRDDVPDKLKNKAKAATETNPKKFNTISKKG